MGVVAFDEAVVAVLEAHDLSALTGADEPSYSVVGPCDGGSTSGAWRVEAAGGAALIVKLALTAATERYELMGARVDRLRAAGYPAPRHVLCPTDDRLLIVQEVVPGAADPIINAALAADVMAHVARQAGLGLDDPQADARRDEFPDYVRRSLVTGLDGYCEHASLAAYSDATRRILDRARGLGAALRGGDLPAADLIHGDFHTANLMSLDGRTLSATIDWDSVSVGDRLFDLARLAFTAMRQPDEDALSLLWAPLLERDVRTRAEAYVAHTAVIVIDWRLTRRAPGAAAYAIRAAETAFAWLDAGRFLGFPA